MARAMLRINYATVRFCTLAAAALAALSATACGQDGSAEDDATTYSLDFAVGDAGADSTGWRFDKDSQAADGTSGTADGALSDGSGSGGDATALHPDGTSGDGSAGDVGPADTGPTPTATCAGSCGIKLEMNPCHCDHGCGARGDCCAGFTVACACAGNADCDDANPCTTDTCKTLPGGEKLCLQVPFFGCCSSDAACGSAGNNKCIKPTCLQGTCSDVQKDCDDGVACTLDVCDPATGDCAHKLSATKCLIDGACHGAGASQPNSGGCVLCQPDKAQDAWTAKAGTCLIDGICAKSGESASTASGECRVCIPSKSTTIWSVSSGACYIDKTCHIGGAKSPANPSCATCQPVKSQTAWSGVAGKCAVGDQCYASGASDPTVACAVCDPAKSSSSLTPKAGFCVIDGGCVAAGASKSGAFGCQTCVPAKSLTAWTQTKPGTVCSDDDPCSIDTLCTTAGLCKGKTQPNCCKSDAECVGKVNPETCQKVVCKGSGVCAAVPDPDCCSAGKCCDLTIGKLRPAGTPCSTTVIKTEYKCQNNTGYKRGFFPACTGKLGEANKCSTSPPSPGPWVVLKACGPTTTCAQSSPSFPPVCK